MKDRITLWKLAVIFGAFLLFASCASSKRTVLASLSKESYCNPPGNFHHFNVQAIKDAKSVLATNADLRNRYSVPSILIMDALGLDDEVRTIEALRTDTALRTQLKVSTLKQKINSKMLLVNSEIDATTAELDCEGERVEQIAGYINEINSNNDTRLTVASIVLGAISGLAGAVISDSGWDNGVAIGTGVAGTALGFVMLNPKGKKAQLKHDRNLLENVWSNTNNGEMAPFLWYMLTEEAFSNSGETSLLHNLRERWIMYQFEDDKDAAAKSVNFTKGGTYRADDLYARAQMINQLQAVARSTSQHLNAFLMELDTLEVD